MARQATNKGHAAPHSTQAAALVCGGWLEGARLRNGGEEGSVDVVEERGELLALRLRHVAPEELVARGLVLAYPLDLHARATATGGNARLWCGCCAAKQLRRALVSLQKAAGVIGMRCPQGSCAQARVSLGL